MATRRGKRKAPPQAAIVKRYTRRQVRWTKPLVALLGKVPDSTLARKSGIQPGSVRAERRRRRIEPFKPRRPPVEWTQERIALLGTDSDASVAAILGVSVGSVRTKRWHLGIPSYYPPPHSGLQGHRWTPAEVGLLGKLSDREVGEIVGLGTSAVARKRHQLGIPPCYPPPPKIRWTKRMLSLLGRITDNAFAERFRVSRPRVLAKRVELGIPAHFEKRPIERTAGLLRLLRLPSSMVRRATGLKFDTIVELRHELGIPGPTIG